MVSKKQWMPEELERRFDALRGPIPLTRSQAAAMCGRTSIYIKSMIDGRVTISEKSQMAVKSALLSRAREMRKLLREAETEVEENLYQALSDWFEELAK